MHRIPAPLVLILALVLLQVGSALAKTLITNENAFGLTFLRLAVGGTLLCVFLRPNLRKLTRANWRDLLVFGTVFLCFNLSVYSALVHLPLGLVATIGFLGPLLISLAGARNVWGLLWPAVGFAGVLMLAPGIEAEDTISWIGIGYGLAYAVSWAGYILASARVTRTIDGLDGFAIATVIAAILCIPFGLGQSGDFLTSPMIAGLALVVAILAILPFGLEFLVLKRLSPHVFGTMLSLEPAIATLAGLFILGEWLPLQSWLAIAAVTIASVGATQAKSQN